MPLPTIDEAVKTLAELGREPTKGPDRDRKRLALIVLGREEHPVKAIHKEIGRSLTKEENEVYSAAR